MHKAAYAFVAATLAALPPRACVVEFGSRWVNGSIRTLLPGAWYLGIDRLPGRGVDVVADAATWDPPLAPDTVLCCEVLEHTEAAAAIVANAHRILAPDGVFIATMATDPRPAHSAIDAGPLQPGEWYQNVAAADLMDWLAAAGFPAATVRSELHPTRGDLYTIARKEAADAAQPQVYDVPDLRTALTGGGRPRV